MRRSKPSSKPTVSASQDRVYSPASDILELVETYKGSDVVNHSNEHYRAPSEPHCRANCQFARQRDFNKVSSAEAEVELEELALHLGPTWCGKEGRASGVDQNADGSSLRSLLPTPRGYELRALRLPSPPTSLSPTPAVQSKDDGSATEAQALKWFASTGILTLISEEFRRLGASVLEDDEVAVGAGRGAGTLETTLEAMRVMSAEKLESVLHEMVPEMTDLLLHNLEMDGQPLPPRPVRAQAAAMAPTPAYTSHANADEVNSQLRSQLEAMAAQMKDMEKKLETERKHCQQQDAEIQQLRLSLQKPQAQRQTYHGGGNSSDLVVVTRDVPQNFQPPTRMAPTPATWGTSLVATPQEPILLRSTAIDQMNAEGKRAIMMSSQKNGELNSPALHVDSQRSVVSMLQQVIYCTEGTRPRFFLFRLNGLQQQVRVHYSTVDGLGTAEAGRHYESTSGIAVFEKGQTMTHFDVQVCDDEGWEPIRDFVATLEGVDHGNAVIGTLDTTTCVCVDDDIYPLKVDRTNFYPQHLSEDGLPSCINSDKFLTPTETDDFTLIRGFIMERWQTLWPFSGWGALWSVYRGMHGVAMSLILVMFIDCVYIDAETQMAESPMCADLDKTNRITLAGALCAFLLVSTYVQSCTETWVAENAKLGLTGKHLRDWIVAQIMWADAERLSKHRSADYLNAGTSEVEASSAIFEMIFPGIEKLSHFFFNMALICYIDAQYLPIFFMLVPIAVFTQRSRGSQMSRLLDKRQLSERQYVSSLADIIENTHTFRSMPESDIRRAFGKDTASFAKAHLTALKYSITTKERIEYVQGLILAGLFFISAILTNTVTKREDGSYSNTLTKGMAVGIINAFTTSSSDIIDISNMFIKMKFQSEGLRMVARILNFPTDSHQLAEEASTSLAKTQSYMLSHKVGDESPLPAPQRRPHTIQSPDGENAPVDKEEAETSKDRLRWVDEIELKDAGFMCNVRRALHGAKLHEKDTGKNTTAATIRLNCKIKLGGMILITEYDADNAEEGHHHDHDTERDRQERDAMLRREKEAHAAVGVVEDELTVHHHQDIRDSVLKLIMGVIISPPHDFGSLYRPEFLRYAYISESPALLEGSILKNLMLGVDPTRAEFAANGCFGGHAKSRAPSAEDAWRIAQMCGLNEDFLESPETFNVGKGGRNLPMEARVAICIARGILSDAHVLMLSKPTALLNVHSANKMLQVLRDYCDFGGLRGLLESSSCPKKAHDSGTDWVLGKGDRSVILTMPLGSHKHFMWCIDREVYVESHTDEEPVQVAKPYHSGWMWKTGQMNPKAKRRFFRMERGILNYYKDEADHKCCGWFYCRGMVVSMERSNDSSSFTITEKSGKVVHLRCDSPEAGEKWMSKLQEAIDFEQRLVDAHPHYTDEDFRKADSAYVKRAFAQADKDRSGHIDFEEFVGMVVNQGRDREELRRIYETFDVDKNGEIDLQEFARYYSHMQDVSETADAAKYALRTEKMEHAEF